MVIPQHEHVCAAMDDEEDDDSGDIGFGGPLGLNLRKWSSLSITQAVLDKDFKRYIVAEYRPWSVIRRSWYQVSVAF